MRSKRNTFVGIRWQVMSIKLFPSVPYVKRPSVRSIKFMTAKNPKGYDSIMNVVDQFSKMVKFIPCHTSNDASHIVYPYFKEVIKLHSVPRCIASYRDIKFMSHFRSYLWRLLGTKLLFNTTCHAETDGQIEFTNQTLSTLHRGIVSKNLKEWDLKLPHVEFAYNQAPTYVTPHSSFESY